MILPVPVILNRLATDLRVLIDLAFFCIWLWPPSSKKGGKFSQWPAAAQAIFWTILFFVAGVRLAKRLQLLTRFLLP